MAVPKVERFEPVTLGHIRGHGFRGLEGPHGQASALVPLQENANPVRPGIFHLARDVAPRSRNPRFPALAALGGKSKFQWSPLLPRALIRALARRMACFASATVTAKNSYRGWTRA